MVRTNPSVLFCSDYISPIGGVEIVLNESVTRLQKRGYDLGIFTLDGSSGEKSDTIYENVTITCSHSIDLTPVLGLQSQFSITAIPSLYRAYKDQNPDIVHIHNRYFFTSVAAAALKKIGIIDAPLVLTLHAGPSNTVEGLGGVLARLYERSIGRFIVRQSDVVIAVSQAVADHGYRLGAEPERTVVINNGVDTDFFSPPVNSTPGKEILFVGRLTQNKGPHVLIQAASTIFERHPESTVHIVGTGPLRNQLESEVAKKTYSDRIHFHGTVPRTSVAELMRSSDVFCLPSFSEGMPLTLLESMASGLPAVVTRTHGVREIITDGVDGVFIEMGNPDDLAENICRLLDDPKRATSIAKQARAKIVEKYDWERRVEEVCRVYQRILDPD